MSCLGQRQRLNDMAAVATSIVTSTPRRFYQAFYLVALVFLLLISLPTTHAFQAIPIRRPARAHPEPTPTSTRTQTMPRQNPAIRRSGSKLRLLSSTGSTSSIPAMPPPTATERSSSPAAAVDEDLPALSTPIAAEAVLFADVVTVHAPVDNRMACEDPGELIARLKASKLGAGTQPEQADGESFQVRSC